MSAIVLSFGNWFEEVETGKPYEYLGESRAQFAGVEVACIRDLAGNEKQPALCDFHEKYKQIRGTHE